MIFSPKRHRLLQLIQMQPGESGAVCLSMILAYYGSFPPREKINELCGVTNNGVSEEKLLSATRQLGMEVSVSNKMSNLRDANLPCIIALTNNRYMVVKAVKNKEYVLNDPSEGRVRLNEASLEKQFGGVIEIRPGANFLIEGKSTGFFKQIRHRLQMSISPLVFVLLAGFILILPGVILPALNKVFFDDIVIQNQADWFKPMLTLMFFILVIGGIIVYVQQRKVLLIELRMSLVESSRFFQHIFKLPISFFTNRHPGEVFKRIQLNDDIATLLSTNLTTTIISIATVVLYALVMLEYSVLLTVTGVGILLGNLFALRFISAKRTALNQVLFENQQKTFSTAGIGIEQIETIKATGSENDFYELWSGYLTGTINNEQKIGISSRILEVLPDFLSQMSSIIILILGGILIMKGDISIGLFIALQSLMGNFTGPVKNVVDVAGQVQLSKSNLATISDTMDTQVDPLFRKDEVQLNDIQSSDAYLHGLIEVKNITFGYDRFSPPLINDFSLTISPGKRIAIVGGSGSGKSTIAKIISGIYQPWSGAILFDEKDRNDINPDILRNSFSMVDQDIFLFMGTITDNITMWNKSIAQEEVIKAAEDAYIHDIISSRPDAYNGKVAPGGGNFSGGQRQRIEIARALVTNPSILVLDEATSALDTDTEHIIDQNIRRRGCTTIIIAHRLSTIKDSDEIIVMERGKVVQRGTHEELSLQKDKLYYQLINTGSEKNA